jgi:hypothetical protein
MIETKALTEKEKKGKKTSIRGTYRNTGTNWFPERKCYEI